MFNQNGLSLDQAPPISVVFRFFLSGALFGILSHTHTHTLTQSFHGSEK